MDRINSIRTVLEEIVKVYERMLSLLNTERQNHEPQLISAINDAEQQIRLMNEYLSNSEFLEEEYISRLDLSIVNYVDNNLCTEDGLNWSDEKINEKNRILDCLMFYVDILSQARKASITS
ncbi:hypothetical protein GCM10028806_29700 [Spirosoma terrae]|uniref:Uncharacterized protein n=1 Tax=Spirosoma terrae TaxID=1968276 RepID=A0A6L9LEU5_9BACT|nr:hypothetical protein [Spirosoma terrae]NDU99096.1 hypothetical protein [Spirosoma terrae]